MHVLNGDNGDSARAGTNIEYELLAVDGKVVLKAAVPDDVSVDSLLPEVDSASYSSSERKWLEAVCAELQTLETVEQVNKRDPTLLTDKKRSKLAFLSFPVGFQGETCASAYEEAQAAAIGTASLLFRSIFGTQQRQFASVLLNASQFRGSEWTTATIICKGKHNGIDCSHSTGKGRVDQQRYVSRFGFSLNISRFGFYLYLSLYGFTLSSLTSLQAATRRGEKPAGDAGPGGLRLCSGRIGSSSGNIVDAQARALH